MMMNVMARPDPRDLYGRPDDKEDYLKGFDKGVKVGCVIAYSPNGFVERDIDRDVAVAVENAMKVFKTLGARVSRTRPTCRARPAQDPNARRQSNVVMLVKSFSEERRALMDPGLLKRQRRIRRQSRPGKQWRRRSTSASSSARSANWFMARYDLLLTPTMPMTAFAVNENGAWGGDGVDIGWTPFTLPFNLTRQPAATIPCGLDREGLPIGLQIVGIHAAMRWSRVPPPPTSACARFRAPPLAHQV